MREHFENAHDISHVAVITPAAAHHTELFSWFSKELFSWHENPTTPEGHRSLLRKIKPSIVLTPTTGLDVLDTPILAAAKAEDIPTLTFIASWDNVFKMERLFKRGYGGAHKGAAANRILPDYYAVWNQMNKDHLHRLLPEISSESVVVTGPPRFDYFTHADRIPGNDALRSYLGISETNSKLLHAATTELYPFEYVISAISKAAQSHELHAPVSLYASVHPGGDIERHRALEQYGATVRYSFGRRTRAPHPSFLYVPTDEETYMLISLFKHTAVLVNQSSTVAIESLAADVPVINVKYGQPRDWWHWYRSMVYRDFKQHYRYITEEGATTVVGSPIELRKALNDYLDDPALHASERARTLRKMITNSDGSSSERLLEYARQCAT